MPKANWRFEKQIDDSGQLELFKWSFLWFQKSLEIELTLKLQQMMDAAREMCS